MQLLQALLPMIREKEVKWNAAGTSSLSEPVLQV